MEGPSVDLQKLLQQLSSALRNGDNLSISKASMALLRVFSLISPSLTPVLSRTLSPLLPIMLEVGLQGKATEHLLELVWVITEYEPFELPVDRLWSKVTSGGEGVAWAGLLLARAGAHEAIEECLRRWPSLVQSDDMVRVMLARVKLTPTEPSIGPVLIEAVKQFKRIGSLMLVYEWYGYFGNFLGKGDSIVDAFAMAGAGGGPSYESCVLKLPSSIELDLLRSLCPLPGMEFDQGLAVLLRVISGQEGDEIMRYTYGFSSVWRRSQELSPERQLVAVTKVWEVVKAVYMQGGAGKHLFTSIVTVLEDIMHFVVPQPHVFAMVVDSLSCIEGFRAASSTHFYDLLDKLNAATTPENVSCFLKGYLKATTRVDALALARDSFLMAIFTNWVRHTPEDVVLNVYLPYVETHYSNPPKQVSAQAVLLYSECITQYPGPVLNASEDFIGAMLSQTPRLIPLAAMAKCFSTAVREGSNDKIFQGMFGVYCMDLLRHRISREFVSRKRLPKKLAILLLHSLQWVGLNHISQALGVVTSLYEELSQSSRTELASMMRVVLCNNFDLKTKDICIHWHLETLYNLKIVLPNHL